MVGYMTYLPCCISAVGWDYLQMIEKCEVLEKIRSIDGDAAGVGRFGAAEPSAPLGWTADVGAFHRVRCGHEQRVGGDGSLRMHSDLVQRWPKHSRAAPV